MLRLLPTLVILLALLFGASLHALVAPALAILADVAADDGDWADLAADYGIDVEDGRVLFAADANGRYTLWDGDVALGVPHYFPPLLLETLSLEFPEALILPESTDRYLHLAAPPAQVLAIAEFLHTKCPNLAVVQINKPAATYGGVVSQGVARTHADVYHAAGLTGQGTRVAVLDLGFGGVTSKVAGEIGAFLHLPTQSNLDADSEVHGAACAEILRDVAPDAEMLLMRLSNLGTSGATNAALSYGCSVMSVSVAWMGYPANGPECDAARHAIDNGLIWVNASGNWQHRRYWETGNEIADANGWLRFAPGQTLNAVTPSGGFIQLGFGYEAPDSSWARYQIVLFENSGNGWTQVNAGGSGYFQYVQYSTVSGRDYAFGIRETQAGTPGRMRVQTFYNNLGYYSEDGSITNPATVPGVVSVGAISQGNYPSGGPATNYSSRGGGVFNLPLTLCGPTGCQTLTYNGAFHGTSCATPHVAGMLALLLGFPPTAKDPLAALALNSTWSAELGWGAAYMDVQTLHDQLILAYPEHHELPDGAALLAYPGVQFKALGGQPPYAFTLAGGDLPSGMSLSASGTLNGTPYEDGIWEFSVLVSDSALRTDERAFVLRILPAGSLLILTPFSGALPSGGRGSPYMPVALQAAGGSGGITFAVQAGALPPGLKLSTTGTISGTPNRVGTWAFTVRAADGGGATYDRDYFIAVTGPSPIRKPQGGCAATPGQPIGVGVVILLLALAGLRSRARTCRKAG